MWDCTSWGGCTIRAKCADKGDYADYSNDAGIFGCSNRAGCEGAVLVVQIVAIVGVMPIGAHPPPQFIQPGQLTQQLQIGRPEQSADTPQFIQPGQVARPDLCPVWGVSGRVVRVVTENAELRKTPSSIFAQTMSKFTKVTKVFKSSASAPPFGGGRNPFPHL